MPSYGWTYVAVYHFVCAMRGLIHDMQWELFPAGSITSSLLTNDQPTKVVVEEMGVGEDSRCHRLLAVIMATLFAQYCFLLERNRFFAHPVCLSDALYVWQASIPCTIAMLARNEQVF